MSALALFIGIAAGAMAFVLSPFQGLLVYVAASAWCPYYLTVQLGTLDFSVSRIAIMALYANLFLKAGPTKRLRLCWLDRLVIIYFICQVVSAVTTTPFLMVLENRLGATFDMVLPYFAVRLTVVEKKDYLSLLKGLLVIAAPLAVLGLHECLTGYSIIEGGSSLAAGRLDFSRAATTFRVCIMSGLFFAIAGAPCFGLLGQTGIHRWYVRLGLGLAGIGVLSSMSSGPYLAAMLSVGFIGFYRFRRYGKTVLMVVVAMCLILEIISNRHFYDVFGQFTFDHRTAWYRSKLIDVALFDGGMSGHWLVGYGFYDPGWSAKIDMRDHTDIVNDYLRTLANYGLVGLVPFLAMLVVAVKGIITAFKACMNDADRWMVWCLGGMLFGALPTLCTVSLFGEPRTILYMYLGVVPNLAWILAKAGTRRSIPSLPLP